MPNRMKDLWLWALKDPPPHPSCSGCRWVKPQNPVPSAHRSIGHRTDQRVRNRGNCCRWIASMVGRSGADVVGTSGFYGRCALELCPLGFSWGIWAWMPLAVDLYSFPLKIYLFAGGTEAVGWSGALYQGIYSLVYREKKTLFRSVIVLRYISIFIGQYFRVLVTASDPPTWPQAHRFGAYWDKKEPNEFRYLGSNSAASPQKLWHCGVLCHWKSISDT